MYLFIQLVFFFKKVQTRQWTCGNPATCNCGVVLRDHNDVIEFSVCSATLKYGDTTPIQVKARRGKCFSPGISIKKKISGGNVGYEASLYIYMSI